MIPKALKFATLQKKMAPIAAHKALPPTPSPVPGCRRATKATISRPTATPFRRRQRTATQNPTLIFVTYRLVGGLF